LVRYADFAMPTPLRTSGFSCSRLSLLCSRTCATETRPAQSHSFLQDCRAWLHPWCAASALLPHQQPPAGMRVVDCLAYARAYGNESSRPLAKHFRSHSRTRQSNSARTSAFASLPFLPARRAITAPPPPRGPRPACTRITPSAAVRARSPPFSTSSSQCRLTSSVASTVSDVLHARSHCSRADPPAAAVLQLLPHRT
jgi:hypothetical protein